MTRDELEEAVSLSEADIDALEAQIAERDRLLAARDHENAELKARLLKLDPPPPIAQLNGPFVMPNHEQFVRLFDNVTAKHPVLLGGRREVSDEMRADFAKCFRFISTLRRLPNGDVDSTRYLDFWSNAARDWLRSDIGGVFPVVAAAIAAGGVSFTSLERFPFSVSLGLMIGVKEGAKPATNAWLRVLQGGLRAPIPLPDYADRSIGTVRRVSAWGDLH